MNGGLLGQQGTEDGCKMTTISDENDLDRFRNSISYPTCSKCKIYAAPGKALANFAVSTRNIDKMWKEQIAKFTDLKHLEMVDKAEQKQWLYRLMSCPTDDLRGIYFPKRCFMPGEIPLKVSYSCWSSLEKLAYMERILQDNDGADSQPEYLIPITRRQQSREKLSG